MSGYGIAADEQGDLFFSTGNSNSVLTDNLEESAVGLSPDLSTVVDYFTPYNCAQYDERDEDFGAGGVLLPEQTGIPHRAVAAARQREFYIIDRDLGTMGGLVPGGRNKSPNIPIGHCECGSSYFVGLDGVGRVVTNGLRSLRTYQNTVAFPTSPEATNTLPKSVQAGGFFATISSDGTQAGYAIIWAVGRPTSTTPPNVTLYAFNGTATGASLPLLYSAVAGTWPNLSANANIVPVVANGRVYVASYQALTIFGLFGPQPPNIAPLKVTASPADAGPAGPRIFGTIISVSGDHIVVQLRSGVSVSVDLTDALNQNEPAVPFAGENVQVDGASAPDGSFIASSMQATKEPATQIGVRR
jgi:hypothetical protein